MYRFERLLQRTERPKRPPYRIIGQKSSHRSRTEAQLLHQRNLTNTITFRPSLRAKTSLCLKLLPTQPPPPPQAAKP